MRNGRQSLGDVEGGTERAAHLAAVSTLFFFFIIISYLFELEFHGREFSQNREVWNSIKNYIRLPRII